MTVILMLMALTSGALLLGGAAVARAPREAPGEAPGAPFGPPADGEKPPRGMIDMAQACRAVARMAGADAARAGVSLRVAVGGPLLVPGDEASLSSVLARMVETAIASAPGGAVLLTASLHGGRVRVAVLGDAPPPASLAPDAELRDAARAVALQGGTLDIEAGARGLSVVLRLLAPQPDRPAAPAKPEPAVAAAFRQTQVAPA